MPMGVTGKIVIGGVAGVGVPLGVEYAMKGARVTIAGFTTKVSGLIGVVQGVGGLLVASGKVAKSVTPDTKSAMAAMGGSALATGVSIIALEELRKRAQYTFQRNESTRMASRLAQSGGRVSLTEGRRDYQRTDVPVAPLVQEV